MADFINTIDVLGDDAVIDSIIDRSITEFEDNTIKAIGQSAFSECKALKKVSMPLVETLKNSAFYGCSALTDVYLPKVTSLSQDCFKGCAFTEVTDAQFPELLTIGYGSFGSCSNLTEVNHSKVQTISAYNAFSSCKKLNRVTLPACTSLGWGAFGYCSVLTYVYLGAPSQISINTNCFTQSGLMHLVIRSATRASLSSADAFSQTPIANGTGYIYVPAALVEDYKAATNWSAYADQFRALEDHTVDGTTTGELDETKI